MCCWCIEALMCWCVWFMGLMLDVFGDCVWCAGVFNVSDVLMCLFDVLMCLFDVLICWCVTVVMCWCVDVLTCWCAVSVLVRWYADVLMCRWVDGACNLSDVSALLVNNNWDHDIECLFASGASEIFWKLSCIESNLCLIFHVKRQVPKLQNSAPPPVVLKNRVFWWIFFPPATFCWGGQKPAPPTPPPPPYLGGGGEKALIRYIKTHHDTSYSTGSGAANRTRFEFWSEFLPPERFFICFAINRKASSVPVEWAYF